jgi:hypothetical protein
MPLSRYQISSRRNYRMTDAPVLRLIAPLTLSGFVEDGVPEGSGISDGSL